MRNILLIVLFIWCGRLFACMPAVTHNYYIYYLTSGEFDVDAMARHEEHEMAEAWGRYVGQSITDEEGRALATIRPEEMEKSNHPVVVYARRHNDYEMLTYLMLLSRYYAATPDRDAWDYPTHAALMARTTELQAVERLASSYKGKRLAERYLLLRMRCLFAAKDYTGCLRLWRKTGVSKGKTTNQVYRRMIDGLYAGALYRTGRLEEAAALFAERGDVQSARWCMRDNRSLECIKRIYEKNPRAAVLPFMIQDFVNNSQETYDCLRKITTDPDYYGIELGTLMACQPILDKEVSAFVTFAERAAVQMQSQSAMWYSAAAMLCYMQGDYNHAMDNAEKGVNGLGTAVMKDNARAVRLLVMMAGQGLGPLSDGKVKEGQLKGDLKALETAMLPELLWLHGKCEAESGHDVSGRWERCRQRIVHHGLIPLYASHGDDFMTFLWQSYSDYPTSSEARAAYDVSYSSGFCQNLDTIPIDRLKTFYDYCFSNNIERSVLMRWLLKQTYHEPEWFADFMGTRLLRAGRFEEAQACFYGVSTAFLSRQAIAPYMVHRHYNYALWQLRQPLSEETLYAPVDVHINVKRQYCQDVLNIRHNYAKAKGKERVHWAYNLAVLYAQASLNGQCWWLAHYGKSIYSQQRKEDFDFKGEAYRLLGEVLERTTDAEYRQAALLGRCTLSPDSWISEGTPYDEHPTKVLFPKSQQWQDYTRLAEYAASHPVGETISRCAELKRFLKEAGY